MPATKADKVVDATGAGDTFNGAYLAGADRRQVTRRTPAKAAHKVAGIVIGHKGALVDPELVKA